MRAVHRALIPVLSVAAASAALAGCGGGSNGGDPSQQPFSQPQIQRLTCSDWQRLDPRRRLEVIAGLRKILGGRVVGRGASGKGSVLTDKQALSLFNGYCQERFARDFSLYKLYGQAAGFAGRPS